MSLLCLEFRVQGLLCAALRAALLSAAAHRLPAGLPTLPPATLPAAKGQLKKAKGVRS